MAIDFVRLVSQSESVHEATHAACNVLSVNHAFGTVNKQLKEHDGMTVPSSSARTITAHHAQEITNLGESLGLSVNSPADFVIGETDGSMIPMVETYVPETAAPSDK